MRPTYVCSNTFTDMPIIIIREILFLNPMIEGKEILIKTDKN
jgi:hypothetical protein